MDKSFFRIEAGSRKERRVFGFSMLWCGFLLFLDQWSKIVIENSFQLHHAKPVIPGFFDITYALNKGAAWSILEGYGWLLLTIAGAVLVAALLFLRQLTDGYLERYIAIFTVISGIIGNSIDRIWRGAVVDFISVHYKEVYHYPIFNIADCAICIGIAVFMISGIFRPDPQKKKKSLPEQ
ncbi:MAG: signal peptidase II [Lentisphaeria bacterium]|nr:signal peptidase II [Lentisphaeria bacterium]